MNEKHPDRDLEPGHNILQLSADFKDGIEGLFEKFSSSVSVDPSEHMANLVMDSQDGRRIILATLLPSATRNEHGFIKEVGATIFTYDKDKSTFIDYNLDDRGVVEKRITVTPRSETTYRPKYLEGGMGLMVAEPEVMNIGETSEHSCSTEEIRELNGLISGLEPATIKR